MRRKERKNYAGIIVSSFIAFIMVTSIIGYIFADRQEQIVKYNGIKFTATPNGWRANIEGKSYLFSYDPKSLEDIEFPETISFDGVVEIDATYESNSSYKEDIARSIFEFASLLSGSSIYVRPGFTANSSFDIPIITCEDATPFVPVLYYKNSNQTLITHQGSCIIIESQDGNSFLASTDRIIYKLLGIME